MLRPGALFLDEIYTKIWLLDLSANRAQALQHLAAVQWIIPGGYLLHSNWCKLGYNLLVSWVIFEHPGQTTSDPRSKRAVMSYCPSQDERP
jgi:hypothetical protein